MAIVTFNNDNVDSSCNLTVTLDSGQTVNVGMVNFPYYFNPTDHNLGPNDVEGNYSFDCGSCVYEFIVTAGDVTTTTTPTPTTTTTTTEEDITTTTTEEDITTTTTPTPTTTTTTTEEDITTTTTPTPTTTTTLPLLECEDITITIPGGLEGSRISLNTINATKGNENFTVTGVSPNMIQAGSYNYSVTIEVPSTYSNEGPLTCSGIEVIGLTTTTTSTTTENPCVNNTSEVWISGAQVSEGDFCGSAHSVTQTVYAPVGGTTQLGNLLCYSNGNPVNNGTYIISDVEYVYQGVTGFTYITVVDGIVIENGTYTRCGGNGNGDGIDGGGNEF